MLPAMLILRVQYFEMLTLYHSNAKEQVFGHVNAEYGRHGEYRRIIESDGAAHAHAPLR